MNLQSAIETLRAVLCDPTGKCCIEGSEGDRKQVESALSALASLKGEADLRDKIGEVFGIGAAARTDSTILANATNAARFADYLHAVEDELFTVATGAEPWDEETPESECLVSSFGAESKQQYVEQVRAAIAKLYTTPPAPQAEDAHSIAKALREFAEAGGHGYLPASLTAWAEQLEAGEGRAVTGVVAPQAVGEEGKWYCPDCNLTMFPRDVTFEETHDVRADGCGNRVTPITTPSPGPQGGGEAAVEATEAPHPNYIEHIQFEGCDRVVLSPEAYEALYELALATPPAQQPGEVTVTDERIEAALAAPFGSYSVSSFISLKSPENIRRLMRAALTAALAPKEKGNG